MIPASPQHTVQGIATSPSPPATQYLQPLHMYQPYVVPAFQTAPLHLGQQYAPPSQFVPQRRPPLQAPQFFLPQVPQSLPPQAFLRTSTSPSPPPQKQFQFSLGTSRTNSAIQPPQWNQRQWSTDTGISSQTNTFQTPSYTNRLISPGSFEAASTSSVSNTDTVSPGNEIYFEDEFETAASGQDSFEQRARLNGIQLSSRGKKGSFLQSVMENRRNNKNARKHATSCSKENTKTFQETATLHGIIIENPDNLESLKTDEKKTIVELNKSNLESGFSDTMTEQKTIEASSDDDTDDSVCSYDIDDGIGILGNQVLFALQSVKSPPRLMDIYKKCKKQIEKEDISTLKTFPEVSSVQSNNLDDGFESTLAHPEDSDTKDLYKTLSTDAGEEHEAVTLTHSESSADEISEGTPESVLRMSEEVATVGDLVSAHSGDVDGELDEILEEPAETIEETPENLLYMTRDDIPQFEVWSSADGQFEEILDDPNETPEVSLETRLTVTEEEVTEDETHPDIENNRKESSNTNNSNRNSMYTFHSENDSVQDINSSIESDTSLQYDNTDQVAELVDKVNKMLSRSSLLRPDAPEFSLKYNCSTSVGEKRSTPPSDLRVDAPTFQHGNRSQDSSYGTNDIETHEDCSSAEWTGLLPSKSTLRVDAPIFSSSTSLSSSHSHDKAVNSDSSLSTLAPSIDGNETNYNFSTDVTIEKTSVPDIWPKLDPPKVRMQREMGTMTPVEFSNQCYSCGGINAGGAAMVHQLVQCQRELLALQKEISLSDLNQQLEDIKRQKAQWVQMFSSMGGQTSLSTMIDAKAISLESQIKAIHAQVKSCHNQLDRGIPLDKMPDFYALDPDVTKTETPTQKLEHMLAGEYSSGNPSACDVAIDFNTRESLAYQTFSTNIELGDPDSHSIMYDDHTGKNVDFPTSDASEVGLNQALSIHERTEEDTVSNVPVDNVPVTEIPGTGWYQDSSHDRNSPIFLPNTESPQPPVLVVPDFCDQYNQEEETTNRTLNELHQHEPTGSSQTVHADSCESEENVYMPTCDDAVEISESTVDTVVEKDSQAVTDEFTFNVRAVKSFMEENWRELETQEKLVYSKQSVSNPEMELSHSETEAINGSCVETEDLNKTSVEKCDVLNHENDLELKRSENLIVNSVDEKCVPKILMESPVPRPSINSETLEIDLEKRSLVEDGSSDNEIVKLTFDGSCSMMPDEESVESNITYKSVGPSLGEESLEMVDEEIPKTCEGQTSFCVNSVTENMTFENIEHPQASVNIDTSELKRSENLIVNSVDEKCVPKILMESPVPRPSINSETLEIDLEKRSLVEDGSSDNEIVKLTFDGSCSMMPDEESVESNITYKSVGPSLGGESLEMVDDEIPKTCEGQTSFCVNSVTENMTFENIEHPQASVNIDTSIEESENFMAGKDNCVETLAAAGLPNVDPYVFKMVLGQLKLAYPNLADSPSMLFNVAVQQTCVLQMYMSSGMAVPTDGASSDANVDPTIAAFEGLNPPSQIKTNPSMNQLSNPNPMISQLNYPNPVMSQLNNSLPVMSQLMPASSPGLAGVNNSFPSVHVSGNTLADPNAVITENASSEMTLEHAAMNYANSESHVNKCVDAEQSMLNNASSESAMPSTMSHPPGFKIDQDLVSSISGMSGERIESASLKKSVDLSSSNSCYRTALDEVDTVDSCSRPDLMRFRTTSPISQLIQPQKPLTAVSPVKRTLDTPPMMQSKKLCETVDSIQDNMLSETKVRTKFAARIESSEMGQHQAKLDKQLPKPLTSLNIKPLSSDKIGHKGNKISGSLKRQIPLQSSQPKGSMLSQHTEKQSISTENPSCTFDGRPDSEGLLAGNEKSYGRIPHRMKSSKPALTPQEPRFPKSTAFTARTPPLPSSTGECWDDEVDETRVFVWGASNTNIGSSSKDMPKKLPPKLSRILAQQAGQYGKAPEYQSPNTKKSLVRANSSDSSTRHVASMGLFSQPLDKAKQDEVAEKKQPKRIEEPEEWQQVTKKKKNRSGVSHVSFRSTLPVESRSSNFEKLIGKMAETYPALNRKEVVEVIDHLRRCRGGLSGMSMNSILECSLGIIQKKYPGRVTKGWKAPASPSVSSTFKPTKNHFKDLISFSQEDTLEDEGEVCVICFYSLEKGNVKTLDCHHSFHECCIKEWVLGRERTCPTCRQHALFPEEFPRLSKD
ncbi:hypothetical protein ScPMuIL_015224 [Solemya velum]